MKLPLREAVWWENNPFIWSCFGLGLRAASYIVSTEVKALRGWETSWMLARTVALMPLPFTVIGAPWSLGWKCTADKIYSKSNIKSLLKLIVLILTCYPTNMFFFPTLSTGHFVSFSLVTGIPGWDPKLGWELPPLRQKDLAYWVPWLDLEHGNSSRSSWVVPGVHGWNPHGFGDCVLNSKKRTPFQVKSEPPKMFKAYIYIGLNMDQLYQTGAFCLSQQ